LIYVVILTFAEEVDGVRAIQDAFNPKL